MHNIIKSARTMEAGFYNFPVNSVGEAPSSDTCEQCDTSAEDEAHKIILEAEQKAQEILAQAVLAAEKAKAEAIQTGLSEISSNREALLEEARTILADARHTRETIIKSAEPQVLELSFLIASALIKTSLLVEKHLIKDIVAEAISLLAGEESIIVKVNPDDLTACREHKLYFQEELTDDASIKILPSTAVAKASCIVQGQYALVESSLADRFNILRDALLREANDDT